MTLYEITDDMMRLVAMAEDPDTDPQTFEDTLEGLLGDMDYKLDGYGAVIKQLEADMATAATMKDLYEKKRKVCDNSIKRMKNAVKTALYASGRKKVKTEHFSFTVSVTEKGTVVVDKDEAGHERWDIIPLDYLVMEPKINKTALKEALKNGAEIPGARLEDSISLRIS